MITCVINFNPLRQVATRFCLTNRLPTSHVNDIVQFMAQASGGGSSAGSSSAPAPDVQASMVAQITALGVDETQARAALDKVNWTSIEAAINALYSE